MLFLLPLSAAIFLLIIAVEDIRNNLISLRWIVASAVFLVIHHMVSMSTLEFLSSTSLNILTVFFLLGGCQLYVILFNRRWVPLFERYMGYGDLALLLVLAVGLPQLSFVLVLIVGMLVGLVFGLFRLFLKKGTQNIPLAGLLSLSAICHLVADPFLGYETTNAFFNLLL